MTKEKALKLADTFDKVMLWFAILSAVSVGALLVWDILRRNSLWAVDWIFLLLNVLVAYGCKTGAAVKMVEKIMS